MKAEELAALNYLRRDHPRPLALAWINRGTDQEMRPTTVAMLLRTLFKGPPSPSVRRLHNSSGLRVSFATTQDRDRFAREFQQARAVELAKRRSELMAVFEKPEAAEAAFAALVAEGVAKPSISILYRAGQFIRSNHSYPAGHSATNVAAVTAGAGLAGAIFGIGLLAIPGVGVVAAAGALASQAAATVGAVGAALGAAGGAMSRVLTDFDVDDREVPFFEMAIRQGKVFVSVDPKTCGQDPTVVHSVLARCGGHFADHAADAA